MWYLILLVVLFGAGCGYQPFEPQDTLVTTSGMLIEFQSPHPDKLYYERLGDDAVHALITYKLATPEEVKKILARDEIFVGADDTWFDCSGVQDDGCTAADGTWTRTTASAAQLLHELLHVLADVRGVSNEDNCAHKHWDTWGASQPLTHTNIRGYASYLGSWLNVSDVFNVRWTRVYQNSEYVEEGQWITTPAVTP